MKPLSILRSFGFALLLILAVKASQAASPEPPAAAGVPLSDADIQTLLRDYIDTDKLGVGIVVGMVDERGTRVVACGNMDNGTDHEVDGDTLFEIGSITKVFTALLLQDMVQRGEMQLNDPIQKYLPASVKAPSFQGKSITLLHLATHTSGLPTEPDNLAAPTWRSPDPQDLYTVEQLYAFLSHYRLPRAPGTTEQYSNVGMQLLGHLIELKSGQSFERLVRERICRPLGMGDTLVTLSPELKSRLALGHSRPGGRVPNMNFILPGAGGLRSTANDLLKFVSAYAGVRSTPLDALMRKAMEFHPVESGGKLMLAWGGNDTLFGHNGGTYGYMAVLNFNPKLRRGIVVLSNCRNSAIVGAMMGPLWERRSPRPADAQPANRILLDRYTGQYQPKGGARCIARREGGRFLLQWIGPAERFPSYEIFPRSESVFRNEFWGVQAFFSQASPGHPAKMTLTSLGPYSGLNEPLTLTRIARDIPPPPALVQLDDGIFRRYVGQYRKALLLGLFHVGPTLSISQETDELGVHLIARVKGLPGYTEAEFIPVSKTGFVVNPMSTVDDIRLTFLPDKTGRTAGVRVYWNGKRLKGERISEAPAA